jgi:hypothetical protein
METRQGSLAPTGVRSRGPGREVRHASATIEYGCGFRRGRTQTSASSYLGTANEEEAPPSSAPRSPGRQPALPPRPRRTRRRPTAAKSSWTIQGWPICRPGGIRGGRNTRKGVSPGSLRRIELMGRVEPPSSDRAMSAQVFAVINRAGNASSSRGEAEAVFEVVLRHRRAKVATAYGSGNPW